MLKKREKKFTEKKKKGKQAEERRPFQNESSNTVDNKGKQLVHPIHRENHINILLQDKELIHGPQIYARNPLYFLQFLDGNCKVSATSATVFQLSVSCTGKFSMLFFIRWNKIFLFSASPAV